MDKQLTLEEVQHLCRRALIGRKGGYIGMIAQRVGTSKVTVRSALQRDDVLRLTKTERKCLQVAAEVAKPFISECYQLGDQLQSVLK